MRLMKRFGAGFGLNFVFWMIAWMALVPGQGIAIEEVVFVPGVVLGDPGDGLESGGVEGIWIEDLGGPVPTYCGDPDDGLDIPGDPEDGLDLCRIFGDPGDGMDNTLPSCFGDPLNRLTILPIWGWFWVP